MSKFKVGDTVRVKEDAVQVGWLRRGKEAAITSITYGYSQRYGDLYEFAVPEDYDDLWAAQGRYYAHELGLVSPAAPEAREPRIVTVKDVNRLLKKARKVVKVEADSNASFLEYEDALKTFHNAVEEIVNK